MDIFSARNAVAITAHDTNPINPVPVKVYVGGAGTVIGRAQGSSADVTFLGVPAGTVLPIRFQYIRSTGTTATGLIGLV